MVKSVALKQFECQRYPCIFTNYFDEIASHLLYLKEEKYFLFLYLKSQKENNSYLHTPTKAIYIIIFIITTLAFSLK